MAAVEGTNAAHDEELPTQPTPTPPQRRPDDILQLVSRDIASADVAAGRVYRMRLASWETDGGRVTSP